jgi:hypothetical protein
VAGTGRRDASPRAACLPIGEVGSEGAFHRRAWHWAKEIGVRRAPTAAWALAATRVAQWSPCWCGAHRPHPGVFASPAACDCDLLALATERAAPTWRRLWAQWVLEDAIAELVQRAPAMASPNAIDGVIRPLLSALRPRLAPSRWRAAWDWTLARGDGAASSLTDFLDGVQAVAYSRRPTGCPRPLRHRALCGTGWLLAVECTRLGLHFDDASPDDALRSAD